MNRIALSTQLHRVQTFLAVVELGSYTKAADYLSISKAMASLHVKALEEALAVTLLLRSTRSIALTEAGQDFYDEFKELVGQLENKFEMAMQGRKRIAGTLRLSTTGEYGERFILPLVARFVQQYPAISIRYDTNSSLSDLIAEKLDLVVRLGSLADSDFKSRKLDDYDILLVASPALLKKHPVRQPADLAQLPWIANSNLQSPTQWTLRGPQNKSTEVKGSAAHHANTSAAIRLMALSSMGVAVLPAWLIEQDLHSGALQQLLPGYSLPRQSISAVFPNSSHLPHKTRAFIDFLSKNLGPSAKRPALV
ncbi:LysR family transcriptional regulator [Comamonas piscis]|uniref:LysR family transcriptional regulator n=1 Tax=Comamonas piscis TaxID=1562974 RepID=A0A7G5EKV3_9BURK|nr:LysR family transcriptional regulator [Comamonas piscis]QMV74628.1 LysR family transcriptional regulator [Comamonas piscis]WSO33089.1 LysR family transcriptional regulator [Comamonas piscis]